MALVYITTHDENICNIENIRVGGSYYKLPKYKSVYRKNFKDEFINQIEQEASKKYFRKTVGYVETASCNAANYLNKGDVVMFRKLSDHVSSSSRKLPPVPKKAAIFKNERNKKINFILTNVEKLKMAVPINFSYGYVDTAGGERHNLQGSGLIPEYVHSKKFGKAPAYLKTLQRKVQTVKSNSQLKVKENSQTIKKLGDSERNTILMGLRANYSQLHKTFQLLPIFTDTIPKKQRKRNLEQELKRLEQDILLMESNSVIFICDD